MRKFKICKRGGLYRIKLQAENNLTVNWWLKKVLVSLLSLFKTRFTNWINRSLIAKFFKIFQSSQQSRIILDSSFHWGFLIHCIYVNDDKLKCTIRNESMLLRNKILAKMQRTEGSWIHFKFPFNEKRIRTTNFQFTKSLSDGNNITLTIWEHC